MTHHARFPETVDIPLMRSQRWRKDPTGLHASVTAFLTHLATNAEVGTNTIRHYAHDLDMFLRYLGQCRPRVKSFEDVKTITVLGYLRYMQSIRGNAQESNRRRLASLRRFFTYHGRCHPLLYDPTDDLKIRANRSGPPVTLTVRECCRLLRATQETAFPERDHAVFRLFLTSGCTLSELVQLQIDDVQINESGEQPMGHVTFVGRKQRSRTVRLSPGCLDALTAYRSVRPKAPSDRSAFFLNRRGEPVTKGAVYHSFGIVCRRAGIDKDVTIHSLRHTCLSLLWESGVSLIVLQQLAGHHSLTSTREYGRAFERHETARPWNWVHPIDAAMESDSPTTPRYT